MTLRQLLNGFRWGSPSGPAIIIDWENRAVTYERMPARLAVRLIRWQRQGDLERARETGEQQR
jgi:hypothetical protein